MSGRKRREAAPSNSTFSIEHVPFCTQDVLPPGRFDPSVRRRGMMPVEKVEKDCWTCGKEAAPLRCPNCNTGLYCDAECMLGDHEVHARYCKADGKFYWPPAPKIVKE